MRPLIVALAGTGFEGRGAGYPGEKKAAEFIAEEFKKIGLEPAGDRVGRSYFQEFKFHPRHPVVPWEMLTSRNVLGFIEGSDPALKHEIVVVGAHYDGQGRAGQADPLRYQPADSGPQNHFTSRAAERMRICRPTRRRRLIMSVSPNTRGMVWRSLWSWPTARNGCPMPPL